MSAPPPADEPRRVLRGSTCPGTRATRDQHGRRPLAFSAGSCRVHVGSRKASQRSPPKSRRRPGRPRAGMGAAARRHPAVDEHHHADLASPRARWRPPGGGRGSATCTLAVDVPMTRPRGLRRWRAGRPPPVPARSRWRSPLCSGWSACRCRSRARCARRRRPRRGAGRPRRGPSTSAMLRLLPGRRHMPVAAPGGTSADRPQAAVHGPRADARGSAGRRARAAGVGVEERAPTDRRGLGPSPRPPVDLQPRRRRPASRALAPTDVLRPGQPDLEVVLPEVRCAGTAGLVVTAGEAAAGSCRCRARSAFQTAGLSPASRQDRRVVAVRLEGRAVIRRAASRLAVVGLTAGRP